MHPITGESGTGTVLFSATAGANTYTGATAIIRGTLKIGATDSLPTGTTLDVDSSTAVEDSIFDLNGFDQTVGALTRSGTGSGGGSFVTNSGAGLNTLTVNQATNTTYNGVIRGNVALTKTGNGVLALTGANTYTGNTRVNAGTLAILNPTIATNSTVIVTNGAFLQLDFTVTNRVAALVLNGTKQVAGVYSSTTGAPFITGSGSLEVVATGPSGPATLTNSVSGGVLSLSWPAGQGWRLQQQTNALSKGLSTNWVYVTDGSVSSTNMTVNPAQPTVFYRLTYP